MLQPGAELLFWCQARDCGESSLWANQVFGNVPGLQVYVVRQAEHHTPNAVDVASGLNIATENA